MREAGPCVLWEEYDLCCFTSHDGVNAALRDRRFGRDYSHVMSREEVGLQPIPDHLKPFYDFEANSMLEMEPPAHTRLRKLVNRAFVSRQIERLHGEIEELANRLIDRFPTDAAFDLLPAYAEKIPVIVIARLLGVTEELADQLLDWSHRMVAMYQFNRSRRTEDDAVEATLAFSDFVRGFIEEKRQRPADDLITALIAATEDGAKLSMDELITTCVLLLNAGHEATVHGIGNSLKTLLQSDQGLKAISQTEKSAYWLVDELLRFDPPLHMFTRFVLEDMEFEGQKLEKGQTVGLLLGSANRDSAKYMDGDRLDFDRGGTGHVSFGAGVHFCVGAPLARLETDVALKTLFRRVPQLRLAEPPRYADRYHFHGLEKLMVQV